MSFCFLLKRKIVGQVYVITNTENNKVYVGVTNGSLERRIKQHFRKALIDRANYKLCVAIREIGKEKFKIQMLCQCNSTSSLIKMEQHYIDKYNSIENGYNTNSAYALGGGFGRIIKVDGKEFKSVLSACNYFNVKPVRFYRRLANGYTLKEALGIDKKIIKLGTPITFEGITYSSHKEIAKAFGVSYTIFNGRIKRNYTLKQALDVEKRGTGKYNAIPVKYKGIQYKSRKALAEAHGVKYSLFDQRLRRGLSIKEALI